MQPNANGGASGGGGGGMPSNVIQTTFVNPAAATINIIGDFDPSTDITITPSSATSRIRLMFSGNGITTSGGSAGLNQILLKRNGTVIPLSTGFVSIGSGAGASGMYVDSPATTSPVTYSLFGGVISTGAAVSIAMSQKSSLAFIAEEIGAAVLPVLNNNIVQTTYGGPNFSVGANTDFPFSVTITPSSVTSRIRIQFLGNGNISPVQSCFLKRNGVIITIGGVKAGFSGTTVANFVFIDSPSTTSAITYNFVTNSAGGTYSYNSGSNVPFIVMIAEEIGP